MGSDIITLLTSVFDNLVVGFGENSNLDPILSDTPQCLANDRLKKE